MAATSTFPGIGWCLQPGRRLSTAFTHDGGVLVQLRSVRRQCTCSVRAALVTPPGGTPSWRPAMLRLSMQGAQDSGATTSGLYGNNEQTRSVRAPLRDAAPYSAVCELAAEAGQLTDAELQRRLESIAGVPAVFPEPEKPLDIPNALEFFRLRTGEWLSKRVTQHMAFRRQESGESRITAQLLEANDERVKQLCALHNFAEDAAMGGCLVTWRATLQWDQEGDAHTGEAIFALVAQPGSNGRCGKILRDRGYAEVVPITGDFYMDEEDALYLVTPYEGGEVSEKFVFAERDILYRFSTVKRMGGFSNATYAVETRIPYTGNGEVLDTSSIEDDDISIFGLSSVDAQQSRQEEDSRLRRFGSLRGRMGDRWESPLGKKIEIDESKLPPSLRSSPQPPSSSSPSTDAD
jgi:hypothetical protein